MNFTIPLYERRAGGDVLCATLGLGPFNVERDGRNLHKVHAGIMDLLRPMILKAKAHEVRRFSMARGMRLERVRLDLALSHGGERRKVTGVYPIVIEPRWASTDDRILFAYHPLRQEDAIPIRPDSPLDEQLRPHLSRAWAHLADDSLEALSCRGRERIDVISFACDTRTLLDDLPDTRERDDDDLGTRRKRRGLRVLSGLGENLAQRAARGDLDAGVPRSPYRERLELLLGAGRSRPVIVVGAPGSGKTTLIHRAVHDLLDQDSYRAHKNLDRVRPVFRISGRRLIAGMSRLGEWEQRCVEVLEDARARDVVLVVDDLARWGAIGRSRDSDRSLADFFRGPLARREIIMIGEATEPEWRHLEQEAPSFASLFTALHLAPMPHAETLRLLVREMRVLEARHAVHVSPHALRSILELGGSLLSTRAAPGNAVDLLREVCRAREDPTRKGRRVTTADVLALLSRKTGVPEILLRGEAKLDPAEVRSALAKQVMGQEEAVKVAVDLVCRVKAGLVDPRRPHGVFLFTGPTGTGKTELAKSIAEYLYGSPSRLLRFDMSELSGPDAPARLIGDRWRPEGLLTQRVIEQPFSLILLDEIEKAHPSVLRLLLQLFEDGRLTDAAGRVAHFQHAVVIMTSNLGARPRPAVGFGEPADAIVHDVARAVREFFPPELFNRIDRVVPFRPLTMEIAVVVAQKELDKLSRRRGLADRSTFLDVGPGVAEAIARTAFAARDGARSVKRFIEDRIGSPLAAAITEGEPAAMQILRLSTNGDGFAIARDALAEASPANVRWTLEPLLDMPLARLVKRLPELAEFVGSLDREGHLARLSDRICFHLANQGDREHAEAIYNLDAMRARIQALHARIEELARSPVEDEHEMIEAERFGFITIAHDWMPEQRMRLWSRRQMPVASRAPRKAEILACFAEGASLRRALRLVDDPTQHAVYVQLARAADLDDRGRFEEAPPGLLEWLVALYGSARGEVEDWWIRGHDGYALRLAPGEKMARAEPSWSTRHLLKIVGLCVRDFFELEAGTHVRTSLARGPEVVHVSVSPAPPGGVDPHAALATPLPAPLPPVVRKLRCEPPNRWSPAPVEIEDYVTGYADAVMATSIASALAPLFLLRSGREDPEDAP